MGRMNNLFVVCVLLLAEAAVAQESGAPPASSVESSRISTVRGCLQGERGNYIIVENKTGALYVLKGVGNKLDKHLHHEVEVKGTLLAGRVKTGVRPEKAGSNPADTVHGVDGIPLQVADVKTDVRTTAKHCKAADQQ